MTRGGAVGRSAVAGLVVAVVVVGALAVAGTAGASAHDGESFVVALDEDGSATVSLELTFDLTTEGDRATFEELETNETRLTQLRAGFDQRLNAVAATAAAGTGREMRVENATASVTTDGGAGQVALSATWTGLARTDGDRLVLSAPFDDSFETSRQFVVRAPAGYEVASASPAPDATDNGTATWAADSSLDGFEVVATPTETAGSSGPGFGVGAALAAVAAVATLGYRRQRG